MGTNCAPFIVDLFLYLYEADFIQSLLQRKEKKLAQSCGFTLRCIDDVLYSKFGDYVDRIDPTTETERSSSYLD